MQTRSRGPVRDPPPSPALGTVRTNYRTPPRNNRNNNNNNTNTNNTPARTTNNNTSTASTTSHTHNMDNQLAHPTPHINSGDLPHTNNNNPNQLLLPYSTNNNNHNSTTTNNTFTRTSTLDHHGGGDTRELWKIADRIPTFEGNSEDNVVTWLQQWQHTLRERQYPERDMVLAFSSRLRGRANEWYYEEVAPYANTTLQMLMDQLRNKFFNEDTKAVNRLALEHYVNKGQGKLTAEQYYEGFAKRLKLIDKPPQRQCIDMLIKGLRTDLRNKASALQAVNALGHNLNDAFESIKRLEYAIIAKGKNSINAIGVDEEVEERPQYVAQSATPYTTINMTYQQPNPTPYQQQREAFEIAQITSRLEVLEAYKQGLHNGR